MKLHKLHVFNLALGTINHGFTIARCYDGVCGCLVNGSAATGTHERYFAQIGIYLLCFGVEHIGSITLNVGGATCHLNAKVVLCDNLHCEMVLLNLDVGVVAHGFHQPSLYLCTCVVGVVKDAELRVSTLTVEVKLAVVLAVKVNAPVDKLFYLLRSVTHNHLNSGRVADVVAGNHRVLDVLLEIVYLKVGDACYAALRKLGVGLVESCLADETNFTLMRPCYLQGVAHAGYSGTDN